MNERELLLAHLPGVADEYGPDPENPHEAFSHELIIRAVEYIKANKLPQVWYHYPENKPVFSGRYIIYYQTNSSGRKKIFIADYDILEGCWLNVIPDVTLLAWMPTPEPPDDPSTGSG